MDYQRLDDFVTRKESQLGKQGFIALVGLGLLLLGAIYVRPEIGYTGAGQYFERLANNPFDRTTDNLLAYRILTPLISYLFGLKGQLFIVTNLIFAAIFIGAVFAHFRQIATRPADALLAAATLTFSTVVLVTIGQSGWCDILSYLAIFTMYRWRSNFLLFTLSFAVALFNHENIIFLLPWFLLLRAYEADSKAKAILLTLLGLVVVIGGYMLFRDWMTADRLIGHSPGFYFEPLLRDPFRWMRRVWLYYPLAFFTVFKVMWIIPMAAFYLQWKEGKKRAALLLGLPLLLASTQLVIAWDSTCMLTLGFLTMVMALEYLFKTDRVEFRRWLPGLVLFNLFVPQLYSASVYILILPSTPAHLLNMLIDNKPWWP